MDKLIKEYQMTGPCVLDIEQVIKLWDHRFVIYEYEKNFQFVKLLRRGSDSREIKCDITVNKAEELIQKLKLVKATAGSPVIFAWRKESYTHFDMKRKPKVKKS